MPSSDSARSVGAGHPQRPPVAGRPRRRAAALHSRPDAGSTTAPATDDPVAHRGHRHRVPGHAVEEVHRAVDRVDHPDGARSPRRAAVLLPHHGVAGAQLGQPLPDQGLQRVVGGGHDVGRCALRRHAGARAPCVALVPRAGQPAEVLRRLGDEVARRCDAGLRARFRRTSPDRRGRSERRDGPRSRSPSDHIAPHHGRAPGPAERSSGAAVGRPEHAQLQWLGTPMRDGLRSAETAPRTAIRRGIRQHLHLQPELRRRPGAPQSAP